MIPTSADSSDPRMNRRRDIRRAVVFCLLVAFTSLAIFRETQRPWEGPTGGAIYGSAQARDTVSEKWLGGFRILWLRGEGAAKPLETEDWFVVGMWAGTLVFGGIFLLLAASAPVWVPMGRRPPQHPPPELPGGWRATRWSFAILAGALALAGALRWPWLDSAILWDEQDNLRRNYHGYYEWREPGSAPEWKEAGFKASFWENRRGNNPHLYSSLAWICNRAWRELTGSPRERYHIVATRLPAAVFGWLAIVSLWWCLNAVGLPRIAPLAALLAAAHPLWSQYSIEARGYAVTLFLSPLLMAFAWRFLKAGRRRDMAGVGTTSLLSLVSFPGSLYFVASLQAVLFLILLVAWWKDRKIFRLVRWSIVNVMAGAVFLLIMAPILPQTAAVMENSFQRGSMPAFWFIMAHNLYATGLQFHYQPEVFFHTDPSAPGALAWVFGDFLRMTPLAIWSLAVFPLLVAMGLWGWWKNGQRVWLALSLAALCAGILCPAHHALVTGCFIYPWYMIYTLPVFLAAFASGLDGVAGRILPRVPEDGKRLALGVMAAFFWVWISYPLFRAGGWKSLHAHTFSRPGFALWSDTAKEIGMVKFTRGRGLWVNYADGFQVYIPSHSDQPDAWDKHLQRPTTSRGRFEPLPSPQPPRP